MNQIRAIQALNKRELENGVPPEASWHTDYRDTAFVNFGGLPYNLTEGDVVTIFSQFGEPVFIRLARDKETGKSKGFGWLKYEDQRSCDLAVDNLGGAEIGGRLVRVDHARYKIRDDEDPEEGRCGWEDVMRKEREAKGERVASDEEEEEEEAEKERRPMIREEIELAKLIEEHDEDDPMKAYLVEEKKKEVEMALVKLDKKGDKERRHKHRHHRSHRSRRDEDKGGDEEDRHRRSKRDETPVAGENGREETPERRRGDSRDRERRHRDEDRERRRDRDRRRERDEDDGNDRRRDKDRQRDRDGDNHDRRKHSDRRDAEERNRDRGTDRDREYRSHRRSRSRSPRSQRDR